MDTLTDKNLENNNLNKNVSDFITSTNSSIGISDRENKNNIHNIAKKNIFRFIIYIMKIINNYLIYSIFITLSFLYILYS